MCISPAVFCDIFTVSILNFTRVDLEKLEFQICMHVHMHVFIIILSYNANTDIILRKCQLKFSIKSPDTITKYLQMRKQEIFFIVLSPQTRN